MDERRRTTRREVLAGAGALGVGALAGCVSAGGSTTVSVLSAGSLSVVFNEVVGPAFADATEYGYRGEFHGSNAVMRMIADDQKHPDVAVSADAALLRDALESGADPAATWDVVFAANEVVLTYNPETDVGKRLAAGDPWYEVLRTADEDVARSDPDLDPLGYRTVMAFELAERYYDEPGLADALTAALEVDADETHLLAAVETGDRAAAVTYRNMAADHDLPLVELPAAINFADPSRADHYAQARYELPSGEVVRGKPVLYNATVPTAADRPTAGRRFVEYLLAHPEHLRENGLVVGESLPQAHGDVPEGVLP